MLLWESAAGYAGQLIFTWSSGVPTSLTASDGAFNAQAEDVGDGWYRVSYTATANNANNLIAFVEASNGSPNPVGEALYVWGAQVELANDYSGKIDDSGSTRFRQHDRRRRA